MNIEDWDLPVQGTVDDVEFVGKNITNKCTQFAIVLTQGEKVRCFNAKIFLENVYEERKRCFIVEKAQEN